MNAANSDVKSIFGMALDLASPAELAVFLDEACRDNPALRADVVSLLEAHEKAVGFLKGAYPGSLTHPATGAEGPGAMIGPYKLLEQIGEGGFGVVFLAEQTEPVRRKVALKVLKAGMDTRQVVARFEAERQALAIMDHSNIARVFDGGQTPSGRPYFVMELVQGTPITEFCDQNHLNVRERLDLFLNVCQAVQHAHQKGVIHRDIKPSNILIAPHDGTSVVKVIDFGIAKAMTGLLTDKTLFTGFAQMLGTPLYMSPEQAGQCNLDVDTRSDIYSLGVLLYELLTGTTPFDKEQLSTMGFEDLMRTIREVEPPKPSTRINTQGTAAATAASTNRKSEPRRLSQQIRGEMDWIVMKALDKDRNRRYETASAFAADVQRHLDDEQVEACPPSAGYRVKKLLRRYKAPVIAVALFTLALVLGTVGTTIGLIRTESALDAEAYQRGLAEANESKMKNALAEAQANNHRAEAERQRAETNFQEAFWCIDHVLNAFDPNRSMGPVTVAGLKQYQTNEALRFLKLVKERSSDNPSVRLQQGAAYVHAGRIYQVLVKRDQAQHEFRQGIAVFDRLVAEFPHDPKYPRELCTALHILADDLHAAGQTQDAIVAYGQCKDVIAEAVRKHPNDVATLQMQALILCDWVDPSLCNPRRALEFAKKADALAKDNPRTLLAVGIAHCRCGEWADAMRTLETSQTLVKEGDWTKAKIACFLAMAQWHCNKPAAALKSYKVAFELMENNFDARNVALLAETATVLGIEGPPAPKANDQAPGKE